MRESKAQKTARAAAILDGLEAHMPEARIELDYTTPLELLVAVMLSAQCTDKRVNLVTPALFRRYRTAADYAAAEVSEVEGFIQTCGLYRAKAKNVVATGKLLVERHGGNVPLDRETLQELPGVGRKTAGVVTTHLGGTPAFPVDTHIQRLAGRLGLSTAKTPDGVEEDLRALVPESRWTTGHQLLIWHGRRTCAARAPACERCVVRAHCPRRGVK
ncbi:MAG: hypothetical protein RL653_1576 [Pseudomonadota bacterium]